MNEMPRVPPQPPTRASSTGIGPESLNVTDYGDPEAPGMMGNVRFDDEGVPGGRTELIREGVLVGRLHSRESAVPYRLPQG